jgi:site-specific DNA-methyltransferase (adenine-specific)
MSKLHKTEAFGGAGLPRVLVADPPWKFSDSLPGRGRGAAKHYPCLSIPDLCRFPLPTLAADATLILWRVASMVEEAYQVCRLWGFTPKTELVWVKRTVTGKRHFGMGHYLRAEHETAIVAVRGRPKPRHHLTRSTFVAPVGRHSAKPDVFYELVAETWAGPYVELFARRLRGPEWTCLGNQVDGEEVGAE